MVDLWDEVHDLPDTATAKDVWIAVNQERWTETLSGRTHWPLSVSIFSTSKATGWDLPREWEIIR
jgi:hypothetical protein